MSWLSPFVLLRFCTLAWVQLAIAAVGAAAQNNAAKKAGAARPVGAANPGVDQQRLSDPLYAQAVADAESGHIKQFGVGWQTNSDFGVIRQHVEQHYAELKAAQQKGLTPASIAEALPKSEGGRALLLAGAGALAYFVIK